MCVLDAAGFFRVLIGTKSFFCFRSILRVILKVMPHTAHHRSLLSAASSSSSRRRHLVSSGVVRSPKAQYKAPPDNPETGDTITVEKEAALARKVSTKTCTSSTAAVHHPPLRPLPPTRQSLGRVVFTVCESCTRPISTNPGSMEACEYWLCLLYTSPSPRD